MKSFVPLLAALWLCGCAAVPDRRGSADVDALLAARGVAAPAWPRDVSAADPALTEPLSLARAQQLAFERNPAIRLAYAELGVAQADVLDARRLFDLRLGLSRLGVSGGPGEQVTRSLALAFTDLLLTPARTRLARTEFERRRLDIAARLFALAGEVEVAWVGYVTAQQVWRLRDAAAIASETSGELASRMQAAGNITALAQAQEVARGRKARVAALEARSRAGEARAELAALLALPFDGAWRTEQKLPLPPAAEALTDTLAASALEQRLDLAAAREALRLREQALTTTRRWRWLGDVEVGYERERDADGTRLAGPTLELGIPLFHWNRAGVLRSRAELESARAEHAALELGVKNDVALRIGELALARAVAEQYRDALPLHDRVVGGTLENYNFMLTDAFSLLGAKREQLELAGEYFDAIAGYWRARARLRMASGGALPEAQAAGAFGADDILATSAAPDPHAGHQGHGGGK
jgi:outer membrane protein, heavy metal efflux system